jgi:hypothetical protein
VKESLKTGFHPSQLGSSHPCMLTCQWPENFTTPISPILLPKEKLMEVSHESLISINDLSFRF